MVTHGGTNRRRSHCGVLSPTDLCDDVIGGDLGGVRWNDRAAGGTREPGEAGRTMVPGGAKIARSQGGAKQTTA